MLTMARSQNVLKKRVEFSSLDLQKRNARLQESEQEIYLMSCVSLFVFT